MPILESKFAPVAFWIGFLALGFVTSLGGPGKAPHTRDARTAASESGRAELRSVRD